MTVEELKHDQHFKDLPDTCKEALAVLIEAVQAHDAKLNGKKKEKPVTAKPSA